MLIARAGKAEKGGSRHFANAYALLSLSLSLFWFYIRRRERRNGRWEIRKVNLGTLVAQSRAWASSFIKRMSTALLPVILLVADVIRRYQMPGGVVTIVISGCHFPRWPRRLSKRALSFDRKEKIEGCPAAAKIRDAPWSTGSRMESRIPLRSRNASRFEPRRADEIRLWCISYFALPRGFCVLSGRERHRASSENEDSVSQKRRRKKRK